MADTIQLVNYGMILKMTLEIFIWIRLSVESFANETLALLPQFILDAYRLNEVIQEYG